MARGCSDSESEEERHDRFKSGRNIGSVPSIRKNIPCSLDSYNSRTRSPIRSNSFKNSRHRSRYSEDRKHSPARRLKSPERHIRDRRSPKSSDAKRSSSLEHKHKSKRTHDKTREEEKKYKEKDMKSTDSHRDRETEHKLKCDRERNRSSREKDRKNDCIKRRKSRDDEIDKVIVEVSGKSCSEKSYDSDSAGYSLSDVSINGSDIVGEIETLPRYYEIIEDSEVKNNADNKHLKKHKRSKERSQSHHESKKRKKDKKHRKKHEKRKSDGDSDSRNIETSEANSLKCLKGASKEALDSIEDIMNEKISGDERVHSEVTDLKGPRITEDEPVAAINTVSDHEEGELSGSESEQYFGPALPPGKKSEKVYGPQRPSDPDLYGPALPPSRAPLPSSPPLPDQQEDEEGSGDVIGPVPVGQESCVQSALDARASLLKYQMENKTQDQDLKKRESWMLELPEVRGTQIGLGPRKFRANAAPDMSDRSSWTDTPQDKARKQLLGTEESCDIDSKKLEVIERNKEMELLSKKSEKKSKSLLDMHQKKLKKKKKKEEKERGDKPIERRPFNRELDLQTNRFDEAQKRSIIKKAQLLDSRFSSGESKFL